jgi:hypothetical protein
MTQTTKSQNTRRLSWTDQGSSHGIRGKKPAPKLLSRGMARRLKLICIIECTIITAQCVPSSERPAVNAVQGENSLGTLGLFPSQMFIEI